MEGLADGKEQVEVVRVMAKAVASGVVQGETEEEGVVSPLVVVEAMTTPVLPLPPQLLQPHQTLKCCRCRLTCDEDLVLTASTLGR